MPLIDHIDGANRDIYLSAATVGMTNLHPMDIYKEYRTLRAADETLRVWSPLMAGYGNVTKSPTKATERYVMLLNGARFIPYDVSHTLGVVGVVITDDGQEGRSCFDRLPLSATTLVEIDYSPPQVEVITVETSTGVSTSDRALLETAATESTKGRKMQTNKAIISGDGLSVSIYDDDGTTLLHTFSVSADQKTRVPV